VPFHVGDDRRGRWAGPSASTTAVREVTGYGRCRRRCRACRTVAHAARRGHEALLDDPQRRGLADHRHVEGPRSRGGALIVTPLAGDGPSTGPLPSAPQRPVVLSTRAPPCRPSGHALAVEGTSGTAPRSEAPRSPPRRGAACRDSHRWGRRLATSPQPTAEAPARSRSRTDRAYQGNAMS